MEPDSHPIASDAPPPHVTIQTHSILESRGYTCTRPATKSRLGPGQLLLLLTGVSVYFAFVQASAGDARAGLVGLMIVVAQAVLAGTSWTGTSILIGRAVRGMKSTGEPAQWLLPVLGIRFAFEILLPPKSPDGLETKDAILAAITCCGLLLPTLVVRLPNVWKTLFCVLVLLHASALILSCLAIWFGLHVVKLSAALFWIRISLGISLPLLLTGFLVYRGDRFGWLHWVGIAAWAVWHVLHPRVLGFVI